MTQDTLRILADETDGRAIVNQNDLDKGLRQIVSDSSAYYLIGYNSSQAPQDGKFHEIKVKVKRLRRAGAPPQGLLGAHRRGDGTRPRAACAGPAERLRDGTRVDYAAARRRRPTRSAPGSARRAARTARPGSRSSGSRRRRRPACGGTRLRA